MTGSNLIKDKLLLLVTEEAQDHSVFEQPSHPVKNSEDYLANEFSKRYSEQLKFVQKWGWLEWDGVCWKKVTPEVIGNYARLVCREAAIQATESGNNLPRSLSSKKTISAVVSIAQGDPRHLSEISEWDTDHWKINTPNGVVDLRTGAILIHSPSYRMTMITKIFPDDTPCPNWHTLLNHVCNGDEDLFEYLKCLCGYILIGDPREESLHFLYGSGGNGKGSFLETLVHILGSYATSAGFDTFTSNGTSHHPTDLAKLSGVRLVTAQEVNEGSVWDMARIKAVTGRDTINARFMRQDFFEFIPRFKLLFGANEKPRFSVVDDAIRRRLHLIPFDRKIPDAMLQKDFKTSLKTVEASGILKFCIEGCLLYQMKGLIPPMTVISATKHYLESEDIFSQWINECCLVGPEYSIQSSKLWSSFEEWAREHGYVVKGGTTFYQNLERRGFTVKSSNKYSLRSGIGLKTNSGTSGTILPYKD